VTLRELRAPLQVIVTVSLLVLLWRLVGGEAVLEKLAGANPAWVAAGFGCATAAMFFAAMRWRYTALCVGAALTVERSLKEFYLAGLLNQILPGGILGDALRAWRHGKSAEHERGGMGKAIRAVVIERMANQMAIASAMLVSLTLWTAMPGAFANVRIWAPLVCAAGLVGLMLIIIAFLARRHRGGRIERFLLDCREALLRPRTMLTQLGLGFLVTGSCVAMFYCAARAVHAPLSLFHLLALVPGALFAMSIPISIGGWGLREASAVALWAMAGLPPENALASSVLYGILALLGALPGAFVLAADR
jgi:glycosyltransferase 2 family protein